MTFTIVEERWALEQPLPVFMTWSCCDGARILTIYMQRERSNRLSQGGGLLNRSRSSLLCRGGTIFWGFFCLSVLYVLFCLFICLFVFCLSVLYVLFLFVYLFVCFLNIVLRPAQEYIVSKKT